MEGFRRDQRSELSSKAYARFFMSSIATLRQSALVAAFLAATWPACLCRAVPEDPKNVFRKNYAAESGVGSGREGVHGMLRGGESKATADRGVGTTLTNESVQETHSQVVKKEHKGRLLVSVVVNSLDKEHLAKTLESVFRLHDQRLALVVSIQHVGDYKNFTPELQAECKKRKITTIELSEVPFDIGHAQSPMWSIMSRDGLHTAQGIFSIDRFINEWGEYDPTRAEKLSNGGSLEGL